MRGDRPTVLVVDDDESIRRVITEALSDEGFRVLAAGNGAEALQVVAAHPTTCLIMLDMQMPEMDGWAFARAYREAARRPAPIVVMTAAQTARTWCDEIGGDDCLAKPFRLDELLAVVERLCP